MAKNELLPHVVSLKSKLCTGNVVSDDIFLEIR